MRGAVLLAPVTAKAEIDLRAAYAKTYGSRSRRFWIWRQGGRGGPRRRVDGMFRSYLLSRCGRHPRAFRRSTG